MNLHLGCGAKNWDGWVGIDGGDFPHLYSNNIVDLPFPDNSVGQIYASHVFEYFNQQEGFNILKKWHQKLKPGGIIRLAVPDFQAMAKLYTSGKFPLSNFLGPLYGKMEMNNETIYHKTVYDFESLSEMLSGVGFVKVKRYCPWDFLGTDYDDCSKAYLPKMDWDGTLISLNIYGMKYDSCL